MCRIKIVSISYTYVQHEMIYCFQFDSNFILSLSIWKEKHSYMNVYIFFSFRKVSNKSFYSSKYGFKVRCIFFIFSTSLSTEEAVNFYVSLVDSKTSLYQINELHATMYVLQFDTFLSPTMNVNVNTVNQLMGS